MSYLGAKLCSRVCRRLCRIENIIDWTHPHVLIHVFLRDNARLSRQKVSCLYEATKYYRFAAIIMIMLTTTIIIVLSAHKKISEVSTIRVPQSIKMHCDDRQHGTRSGGKSISAIRFDVETFSLTDKQQCHRRQAGDGHFVWLALGSVTSLTMILPQWQAYSLSLLSLPCLFLRSFLTRSILRRLVSHTARFTRESFLTIHRAIVRELAADYRVRNCTHGTIHIYRNAYMRIRALRNQPSSARILSPPSPLEIIDCGKRLNID